MEEGVKSGGRDIWAFGCPLRSEWGVSGRRDGPGGQWVPIPRGKSRAWVENID